MTGHHEDATAGYQEINAYGMIGDMHTCALVGPNGSIDWCCLPTFDSPSMFGALLDRRRGGEFQIAPTEYDRSFTSYLSLTNILQTVFLGNGSRVSLTDFMPVERKDGSKSDPGAAHICRIVECHHGAEVRLRVRYRPRPDYGRRQPGLAFSPRVVGGGDTPLWLLCSRDVSWTGESGDGELVLHNGDRVVFVLAYGSPPPIDHVGHWGREQFFRTRGYWESWIRRSLYRGRWQAAVERSALALKLLTFKPTGAIVAAATTSLPETIGGERNWDYRFSWLRDSAFVLNALYLLGFQEEARDYLGFLKKSAESSACQERVLLPIGLTDSKPERSLSNLEGYRGSRPVRIGNAASGQLQLDVPGEIIETLFLHSVYADPTGAETWSYVRKLADGICRRWDQPDEGIWEVRGFRHHFTYSKLMCWVGLDRALRMAADQKLPADVPRWTRTRDQISEFLLRRCVHAERGYFTQSVERRVADASTLQVPIMQFLPAGDPVVQSTIDEVLRQLTSNGLVRRYEGDDGLSGIEGAFNICTFWLVEAWPCPVGWARRPNTSPRHSRRPAPAA